MKNPRNKNYGHIFSHHSLLSETCVLIRNILCWSKTCYLLPRCWPHPKRQNFIMHPIKTALVAKMLLLLMIVNVVATPLPMRPAGKPHTKTGERPLGSGPIDDNDLNPVWRHFDLVRQIVNSKGQLVYVNWKADISKDEVWSLVILSDEMLGSGFDTGRILCIHRVTGWSRIEGPFAPLYQQLVDPIEGEHPLGVGKEVAGGGRFRFR
ncbi:hypothetical protein FB446DRAFT_758491 [Lentinula raphanica]|nr:hypothetical protein FB446DRAFT_758491 [Lentinula raphanica]